MRRPLVRARTICARAGTLRRPISVATQGLLIAIEDQPENESGPARVVGPRRAVSGRAHKRTAVHQSLESDKADYATNRRFWLIPRPPALGRILSRLDPEPAGGVDDDDVSGRTELVLVALHFRRVPAHDLEAVVVAAGIRQRLLRARERSVLQRVGVGAPPPAVRLDRRRSCR